MGQGIQWGSVADWASAFGSVLASITALYLARASTRIKLKGFFGMRLLVGHGRIGPDLIALHVTNIGTRTTKITTISIRSGLLKKRHAIIPNWDERYSSQLPVVLEDSQTANWSFELDEQHSWIRDICKGFAPTWLAVETFRVDVHTSNGGLLVLRPEESMRKRMHEIRKELAANPSPRAQA